ncbi:MAG: S-methyl-5'-thioinosine phosphorylase [Gammaproteobacteria bacterium]|nr:S-methyl-5'-thioinosine phosphorylase [Gammaproteobacteria bacterium]MCZ6716460.1 S-methyl-5'-thioinosine phosphorylase [Gammaproteobacteria bacterium]MCZ6826388.1 S-methyl-5'-thioinosine phosphorylase [Gammaproteobacteria bacterium]
MSALGIIGSSAMDELPGFEQSRASNETTPFGEPSSRLLHGQLYGEPVIFLARHGDGQNIAPHLINYRANVWAFQHAGVEQILAVNVVGGISKRCVSGSLIIPDDLIDYTYGRDQTFFDGTEHGLRHIEFSPPYDENLRQRLSAAASAAEIEIIPDGIHGVMQGPRLETAAEIQRLKRDGCEIVGMTGMPEATLASEIGVAYACCGIVVNQAAGIGSGSIHMEIEATKAEGMGIFQKLLRQFLAS